MNTPDDIEKSRREEVIKLLTNFSSSSSSSSSTTTTTTTNHTTISSVNLPIDTLDNSQKFARFMGCSWSKLVNKALIEYIFKHVSELPIATTISFNIVEEKKPKDPVKRCMIANCLSENKKTPGVVVASAVYLPRNQPFEICSAHMAEFRKDKNWKVSDIISQEER